MILIDGFIDDASFTRRSQSLHQLYIRRRHYMIPNITATQVYKAVSPIIRKNMTHLLIYRLRYYVDLEAIIEEMSAIYDTNTLLTLYHEATDEPYSFLYTNLMQKDRKHMFMHLFPKVFNSKLNYCSY